jgi:hypothetical protein
MRGKKKPTKQKTSTQVLTSKRKPVTYPSRFDSYKAFGDSRLGLTPYSLPYEFPLGQLYRNMEMASNDFNSNNAGSKRTIAVSDNDLKYQAFHALSKGEQEFMSEFIPKYKIVKY